MNRIEEMSREDSVDFGIKPAPKLKKIIQPRLCEPQEYVDNIKLESYENEDDFARKCQEDLDDIFGVLDQPTENQQKKKKLNRA